MSFGRRQLFGFILASHKWLSCSTDRVVWLKLWRRVRKGKSVLRMSWFWPVGHLNPDVFSAFLTLLLALAPTYVPYIHGHYCYSLAKVVLLHVSERVSYVSLHALLELHDPLQHAFSPFIERVSKSILLHPM